MRCIPSRRLQLTVMQYEAGRWRLIVVPPAEPSFGVGVVAGELGMAVGAYTSWRQYGSVGIVPTTQERCSPLRMLGYCAVIMRRIVRPSSAIIHELCKPRDDRSCC